MPSFPPDRFTAAGSDAGHTWAEDDLDVDHDGRLGREDTSLGSGDPWTAAELGHDLEPTVEIGRGGTAQIIAANQGSLGREVALKALRADKDTAGNRHSLVREARVLAQLDHPGVAPVHFLMPDEEGRPQIVMEKVDGLIWTDVIEDPGLFQELGRRESPIDEHLRILRRVCEALQYAHERGILHRDVKPDNIMVGRHGQVWLMDWGMAVSVGPPASGWLRPATSIRQVAGTPGYISPEMATGDGEHIDERSDVYLLGATLHHLLTGHRRHSGSDVLAQLAEAVASPVFDYSDDIPEELADIANRCCARVPDERFASPAEVLAALRDFRRAQGARQISQDARDLAATVLSNLASSGYDEVAHRLDEVRFAYAQALRIAPKTDELRDDLQRFLAEVTRAALSHGDLDVAARCWGAMPFLDEALGTEVDALRQEHSRRRAELALLRDMHDLSSPGLRRQLYFAGVALCSLIWFTGLEVGADQGMWGADHRTLVLAFASITAVFGIVGAKLIPNQDLSHGNRVLRRALMLRVFGAIPFFLLAAALGASIPATLGLHLFLQGGHIVLVTLFLAGAGGLGPASAPSYAAAAFYVLSALTMPFVADNPFFVFGVGTALSQAMLGMRDRLMRDQREP